MQIKKQSLKESNAKALKPSRIAMYVSINNFSARSQRNTIIGAKGRGSKNIYKHEVTRSQHKINEYIFATCKYYKKSNKSILMKKLVAVLDSGSNETRVTDAYKILMKKIKLINI